MEPAEAQRVSRADLFKETTPSPEPDQELQQLLESKLSNVYGDVFNTPVIDNAIAASKVESEAEEFEFRLFSAPRSSTNKSTQSTRVILADEVPLGDGAFITPRREDFYIAKAATGLRKQHFEVAAVSGEDILRQRQVRYRGLERPWKVTVIAASTKAGSKETPSSKSGLIEPKDSKTRPNKKRRILLRTRKRTEEQRSAESKAKAEEKEAAIKDKKKRKNRAQQLKRREKARAAKAAQRGDETEQKSAHDGSDSSDVED